MENEQKIAVNVKTEYIPLLIAYKGKEIGKLTIKDDKLVFTGAAEKSAEEFFYFVKHFIDEYIKYRT